MSAEHWRLIDSGPGEAHYNMALDEALAQSARNNKGDASPVMPPTLRLYAWRDPSVTLGRFQKSSEVDADLCARRGIAIVRRLTGGRAILHGQELTYSFSASTLDGPFAGKDLFESYATLSAAFMQAFLSLGLRAEATSRRDRPLPASHGAHKRTPKNPLCFSSTSFAEISIGDSKIIGSAQRRWPGAMLQQGSIPLRQQKEDAALLFGDHEAVSALMGLCEADPRITYASLRDALVLGFEKALGIRLDPSQPTVDELELAVSLETRKYRTREWNHLR